MGEGGRRKESPRRRLVGRRLAGALWKGTQRSEPGQTDPSLLAKNFLRLLL